MIPFIEPEHPGTPHDIIVTAQSAFRALEERGDISNDLADYACALLARVRQKIGAGFFYVQKDEPINTPHPHYFKSVRGLEYIDVYRLLELYEVTCPVAQHIVKKALAAGKRGSKNQSRDMQDIADSAARWFDMRTEDVARERTQ